MLEKNAIVIFEEVPVRKVWYNKEQWISALDVAKALGYDNPSVEVSRVLKRNKDRFEGYIYTTKLVVQNDNGIEQNRPMIFINLKGVIAFCMLSKQEKAIKFQRWADSVLEKHLNQIPDDIKMIAKTRRVKFTDQLRDHGINKRGHYVNITKSMKTHLDIDENKPKDECDLIEVLKISAAEDIARINILQNNSEGYSEVKPLCDKSADIVKIGTEKSSNILP